MQIIRFRIGLHDCIPLWIERDGGHVRPITRRTGPSSRGAFARLEVQRMPRGEDFVVFACMALRWTHITNPAVPVIDVVPTHEIGRPFSRLCEIPNEVSCK